MMVKDYHSMMVKRDREYSFIKTRSIISTMGGLFCCQHAQEGDEVPVVNFRARVRDHSIVGPNPFDWKNVSSLEVNILYIFKIAPYLILLFSSSRESAALFLLSLELSLQLVPRRIFPVMRETMRQSKIWE